MLSVSCTLIENQSSTVPRTIGGYMKLYTYHLSNNMKDHWMVLSNIINVCVDVQQKSMKATTSESSESESICDTTLCAKVCPWFVTDRWVSPGTLVYSIIKTDRHDIAEILLNMALNTISQTKPSQNPFVNVNVQYQV